MTDVPTLKEAVERLRVVLVGKATGQGAEDDEYKQLREQVLRQERLRGKVPSFVRTCRDLDSFWPHIKTISDTYAGRRAYLRDQFEPLLTLLETEHASPVHDTVQTLIAGGDVHGVSDAWRKAQERLVPDPEGAITAARTLVETVCKHVLDEAGEPYDEKGDLTDLYKAVSKKLKLSPAQHTEEIFKRILGGCTSVVEGLGALRNKHSDAHGKGAKSVRVETRHATLAVNLAGTMAVFLSETWAKRKSEGQP